MCIVRFILFYFWAHSEFWKLLVCRSIQMFLLSFAEVLFLAVKFGIVVPKWTGKETAPCRQLSLQGRPDDLNKYNKCRCYVYFNANYNVHININLCYYPISFASGPIKAVKLWHHFCCSFTIFLLKYFRSISFST